MQHLTSASPRALHPAVRRKRLIAASLVGSALLATITVSSAAGLLGDRWEKQSQNAWQQSVAATRRVQAFARTYYYSETLLPVRLMALLRARVQANRATPSRAAPP